jgi:hypothetical protein
MCCSIFFLETYIYIEIRENVHNILNSPITEEEILQVVKNFKSNKASGYDDIVNEHIKSTININNFCSIEFYKVYLHFSYQSY